jgi:hypothetical protein
MYESLSDIVALIGVATENFELEFKHGHELDGLDDPNRASLVKASIAKDSSAFANAGGGTIIYGVDEQKKDGNSVASAVAPVTSQRVTIDRLTQLIKAGTEPSLSKFRVHSIQPANGLGQIFVVSVDKADTAHQCKSDLKYYHRIEATNQPMHDFEIRDVMNRRTRPSVEVRLSLRQFERKQNVLGKFIVPNLNNNGTLTAAHWSLEVLLPVSAGDMVAQAQPLIINRAPERSFPNYQIYEFSSDRGPLGRQMRLLPGQSLSLDQANGFTNLRVIVTEEKNLEALQRLAPPIVARLFVDNCPMIYHEIPFQEWCDF